MILKASLLLLLLLLLLCRSHHVPMVETVSIWRVSRVLITDRAMQVATAAIDCQLRIFQEGKTPGSTFRILRVLSLRSLPALEYFGSYSTICMDADVDGEGCAITNMLRYLTIS